MKRRPTPREVPERYPYMVIELPDRGDHHMQIPSLLTVAKLVKRLEKAHVAVLAGMSGNMSAVAVMTMIKASGPEMAGTLGALVGLAWFNQTHDLEAKQVSDLLAFGETVYEELHSEGYTLSELSLLALTTVRAIWDHSQLSDEVQARAGIFFPMLGQMRSPDSTSVSITSAIPSDSET